MSRNAEILRELRAKAKAEGRCSICRARWARRGLLTCQECVDATSARQAEWKAAGLCETCGEPRKAGNATHCALHLRRVNEAARQLSAENRARGLCWCGAPRPKGRTGLQCESHRIEVRNRARKAIGVVVPVKGCGKCGGFGHNRRTCAKVPR